jgi:hypothetical protein
VAGCAFVVTCPAAVIGLSGAALLYITIVGIGAQIGLGGALNQTSVSAGHSVQNDWIHWNKSSRSRLRES